MHEKYLIIKTNNEYTNSKTLDSGTFESLKHAAIALETFNTLTFLSNNYIKAKEEFLTYDFSQFNIREIDIFNMFLNALEAMAANKNLWEAFLKRNYYDDDEIYSRDKGNNKKSCFGIKASEYYDACIDYVIAKVLRDMIAHHSKPYSEIIYSDDLCRQFIVTKEELLNLTHLSASSKKYISNSKPDYFNVVNVIKRALEITDEINNYVFNHILQKEWLQFTNARYTIREHIGLDWQGAFLVYSNTKYPEDHLLHLSQISISRHAMNAIGSIAAQSLCSKP